MKPNNLDHIVIEKQKGNSIFGDTLWIRISRCRLRNMNISSNTKSVFYCLKISQTVSGQLPSEENCPPVSVQVSVKVRVGQGQFWSLAAIFLGGNCLRTILYNQKHFNRTFSPNVPQRIMLFQSSALFVLESVTINLNIAMERKSHLNKMKKASVQQVILTVSDIFSARNQRLK